MSDTKQAPHTRRSPYEPEPGEARPRFSRMEPDEVKNATAVEETPAPTPAVETLPPDEPVVEQPDED